MRFVVALLSVVALVVAAPAAADPPTKDEFVEVFTDVNPCTGAEMTVTLAGEVWFHEHGSREVARAERTITTSDGFAGRGTDSYVNNGRILKFRFSDMLTNASGARFRARGVFVLDLRTDTVRVDTFSLTCLGNRA